MALLSDMPAEIIHQILSLLLRLIARVFASPVNPFVTTPSRVFIPPSTSYGPILFALVDTCALEGHAFRHDFVPRIPVPQEQLRLEIPSNISLSQFISAIKKTEASYTDVWEERLLAGHMDAFAGLLIAYLSNTTSLTITSNFIEDFPLVGKILQSKALQSHAQAVQQKASPDQIPKFTRLRRLAYVRRLDQDSEDLEGQFEEAISAFYLPNLLEINLWIANPSTFHWPAGKPNLDHLTSLDIEWLDPFLLTKILSLTRNLKSLSYSWDYIDAIDDEWKIPVLDLDEIIEALSPVKNTLEKLRIDFRVGFGLKDTWPEMSTSGSFKNLIDFNRIKDLRVPFVALSGFEPDYTPLDRYIPPSVETLSLTLDMMEDYLMSWPTVRPDMMDWGQHTKAWGKAKDKFSWTPENSFQSLVLLLAESCPTKLPRLQRIVWLVRMVEDDYIMFKHEAKHLSPLLGIDITVLNNDRFGYYRSEAP